MILHLTEVILWLSPVDQLLRTVAFRAVSDFQTPI